jgi:hypothetical protein
LDVGGENLTLFKRRAGTCSLRSSGGKTSKRKSL